MKIFQYSLISFIYKWASVVWHHSLLLMNSFNKTEAAVFSCRLCFLRVFPFISLIVISTTKYMYLMLFKIISWLWNTLNKHLISKRLKTLKRPTYRMPDMHTLWSVIFSNGNEILWCDSITAADKFNISYTHFSSKCGIWKIWLLQYRVRLN